MANMVFMNAELWEVVEKTWCISAQTDAPGSRLHLFFYGIAETKQGKMMNSGI